MAFHELDIQPDFIQVINDILCGQEDSDSFWLRIDDQTYSIAINKLKQGLEFTCEEDPEIKFSQISAHKFALQLSEEEHILLRTPKSYLLSGLDKRRNINCLDADNSCRVIVVGDDTGTITCLERNAQSVNLTTRLRIPRAHLTDVLLLRVFPSAKVALSIGLDYTVKIWSLEDGSNPRVMSGVQIRRITSVALIGNHCRNFVSGCLDGSACIWECGSGKCVQTLRRVRNLHDGVASLFVQQYEPESADDPEHLMFECHGKRLFCGHESGTVSVWDLGSVSFVGEFTTKSGEDASITMGAVNALAVYGDRIVVGYEKKALVRCYQYEITDTGMAATLVWQVAIGSIDEEQEVKKIEVVDESVLCLCTDDLVSLRITDGATDQYFVGYNSVLNDVKTEGDGVLICGKDGLMMEY